MGTSALVGYAVHSQFINHLNSRIPRPSGLRKVSTPSPGGPHKPATIRTGGLDARGAGWAVLSLERPPGPTQAVPAHHPGPVVGPGRNPRGLDQSARRRPTRVGGPRVLPGVQGIGVGDSWADDGSRDQASRRSPDDWETTRAYRPACVLSWDRVRPEQPNRWLRDPYDWWWGRGPQQWGSLSRSEVRAQGVTVRAPAFTDW